MTLNRQNSQFHSDMTSRETPPLDEIWVAIDVETTGVDPDSDRIIEVGAVKFQGEETRGEFQSLVNPGVEVSEFIEELTGIDRQDLDGAPSFPDIADDLLAFIGSSPVVGHTVGFDLGFLRNHGLAITSPVSDVYDLARVFLPGARSYRLGAIAAELGVHFVETEAHRALYDAEVTRRVFVELVRIAAGADAGVLRQIESIASRSQSSPMTYPLRRIAEGRAAERAAPPMSGISEPTGPYMSGAPEPTRPEIDGDGFDLAGLRARLRYPQALEANAEEEKIDIDAAAGLLEDDGPFARALPGFDRRPQQIEMARSVAEAINDGQRLIVEAGTGVGKSLAYHK